MLLCCLWHNVNWLLIINTSVSSPVKNKRRHLPAASLNNLPRFIAAEYIALGSRTVHSTRWSQIPHHHTTPAFSAPIRGSPSEYCHNIWHGKTRMVWLPDGKKIFKTCLFQPHSWAWQTDTTWWHRLCLHSIMRQKSNNRLWKYICVNNALAASSTEQLVCRLLANNYCIHRMLSLVPHPPTHPVYSSPRCVRLTRP